MPEPKESPEATPAPQDPSYSGGGPGSGGGSGASGGTDWQARFNGLMATFNQKQEELKRVQGELERERGEHLQVKQKLQSLEAEKLNLLSQHTSNVETIQRDRDEKLRQLATTQAELVTLKAIQDARLSTKFAALIRPTTDEAELKRQIEAAAQAQADALETARAQLGRGYVPPSQSNRQVPPTLSGEAIQAYLDEAGDNPEERTRRRQEIIAQLGKPPS